jgi:hypothetical protein
MPQDSIKPWQDFVAAVVDQRDSRTISDLIERLKRDLTETEKSTSKRR